MLLKKAERRHRLRTSDYARLAAFRGAVREFLHFSEDAAARAGLTAQHYQAMLILRACPEDERMTINDLARTICRLTGSNSEIKHAAERSGDVKHSLAAIDKLRSAGFTPTSNFSEGLQESIVFFKKQKV